MAGDYKNTLGVMKGPGKVLELIFGQDRGNPGVMMNKVACVSTWVKLFANPCIQQVLVLP